MQCYQEIWIFFYADDDVYCAYYYCKMTSISKRIGSNIPFNATAVVCGSFTVKDLVYFSTANRFNSTGETAKQLE